ncbi:hypothetical protein CLLI_06260 [Clostridium liquoris]|jgi:hypothetical protein|uniref:DUF2284 domain-containing protein n=1 Tax=Clostridium liquoris TaxID=1289519 RepID=A0A2T0B7U1_9CLOT|nr:hypothetical protein [Clostridium liquoris]PRR79893.1 hypothetical protein CLLI_06260 [Clostridium liquoris]
MNYFEMTEKSLNEICKECKYYGSSECVPPKCNIGFSLNAIKAAYKNGEKSINDGVKLIPKDDMKMYDENALAKSIACICRLCRECKENHNENCIISLSRKSLESTRLPEEVVYPGDVLTYLLNVAKQNQVFSDKIKNEYIGIK